MRSYFAWVHGCSLAHCDIAKITCFGEMVHAGLLARWNGFRRVYGEVCLTVLPASVCMCVSVVEWGVSE